MQESRMSKSGKNIIFAVGTSMVTMICSFIGRTLFVHYLSMEYLGLNGLFSNILSFLSLAELGIGGAMNYALYQPLAEKNTELIKSIMAVYKKIYSIIGVVIFLLGSILTPFLPIIIKDMPSNMPYIYLYYILFVFNSSVSYFYSYKRALIICNQQEYITHISSMVAKVVSVLLQILVLIFMRSYLFFLIIAIICTIGENIIVSKIAEYKFPFLQEKNIQPLNPTYFDVIKKNIKALLCHKIGSTVVFSSDNVIISSFVGLTTVGLYSNYTLLVNVVAGLLAKIFSTITASVGNLVIGENKSYVEEILYRILFANMWLYSFASICFFCLFQPFIKLWIGTEYLLTNGVLTIIVLNFYITGMRRTVWVFKDAAGIFRQDQWKPIVEAIVNTVISIPMAMKFGIAGVLIGTILSTVFISFWIDAYVLFKTYFNKNIGKYLFIQICYMIVTIFTTLVTFFLCKQITGDSLLYLIYQMIICIIVPNFCLCFIYHKRPEFIFFHNLFKSFLQHKCCKNDLNNRV